MAIFDKDGKLTETDTEFDWELWTVRNEAEFEQGVYWTSGRFNPKQLDLAIKRYEEAVASGRYYKVYLARVQVTRSCVWDRAWTVEGGVND